MLAIETHAALFQVISDPLLRIQSIRICTEHKLEVVHTKVKENQLDNGKRKRLCDCLHQLLSQTLHYKSHWRSWASKPSTLTRTP